MFEGIVALFHYKDAQSPDKLGLYPAVCHINAMPERRYLWSSRILVILGAINICFTVILSLTIYLLIPLEGAKPHLLRQQNDELRNMPSTMVQTSALGLQSESFIRQYISLRHTLPDSYVDLHTRFSEKSLFRAYNSSDVWGKFLTQFDIDKLRKYLRKGYRSTVIIDDITPLGNGLYQVRFRNLITKNGQPTSSSSAWQAHLRIAYEGYAPDAPLAAYELNPFGFHVVSYALNYNGRLPVSKSKHP
ncbi:MAG: type IV secretion system protein [Alphaproteobacteria bacterium]|nr:type IV secretion system protein [Alphaproteobacteria bacterium]MBQ9234931.1 type IV secretion system protein [Alphaproteobacteria bacterium]